MFVVIATGKILSRMSIPAAECCAIIYWLSSGVIGTGTIKHEVLMHLRQH
jgi:hypothetical protein